MQYVSVEFSEDTLAEIEERAESEDVSRAQWLREAAMRRAKEAADDDADE